MPPLTVVGVVSRTRNEPPGEEFLGKMPQIYYCFEQNDDSNQTLLVRVANGDPLALANSVRRKVHELDANLPVADVTTMEKNIADSLATRRLTMTLLGVFGLLALLLASIGLYGVMALGVTQRRRELGIRLALGAPRGAIFGLVLRQGMLLVGLGIGAGLLGALGVSQILGSLLYEVSSRDLGVLLIAVSIMAIDALLACFLPAQRATRVDPLVALRED